jgi:glycolate oxidase iron-sulfur subunit
LLRAALSTARLARPVALLLPARLAAMLALAPRSIPDAPALIAGTTIPTAGERRRRVAMLPGCVQQVAAPAINAATVRLLTRLGCEVVIPSGIGCCGALAHHLGREAPALAAAKANIDALKSTETTEPLDAVVINASGCGTMVKDYGKLLRRDPAYATDAARFAGLAQDVSEIVSALGLPPPVAPSAVTVAYHSACSMQHGQRLHALPKQLLETAGFAVRDVPEAHLCCGSAGTYNILQPGLAAQLRDRKVAQIESLAPSVIATGNIGCIMQLAGGTQIPIVHTVELLDWATGGPRPAALG